MSWAFGNWQDFLKKKACRYLLQHYLGQFLKEKLSLDQLSLDLYKGTGKISDLNLDVQAINADLATLNIPVELVDGFIDSISVNIPWTALIQDNTVLEITGLELTLQPKQRDDMGMMAGEMFSSMQSSMTTSLQLAEECLKSENKGSSYSAEPIEGVQKFANMIDSVLSKIKVTLYDTVIRLEHHPPDSPKGVALEIRIKRIEYFDDMATTMNADGSSVDGHSNWEPAAISQKNIHIEGVQLLFDEITRERQTRSRSSSRSTSDGSPPQMFQSTRSSLHSTMFESLDQSTLTSANQSPTSVTGSPTVDSSPVQIAVLTGRQEVKLKTKQNDTLHGPKLEIQCQLGGLHILLSPKQLHGLIELVSGISSPGGQDGRQNYKCGLRNKPMEAQDFERVEVDLQHQLQSGRVQSNNLQAQMQDFSLISDEDNNFYSLSTRQSDMESSFSSNISAVSSRSNSTLPSSAGYQSRKSHRDTHSAPKYHEDPSAELSHYHLRVGFFSVTLFHNNPTPVHGDHGNVDKSIFDMMRGRAEKYFTRVGGVTVAGVAELKDVRKNFAALLEHDHLRLLGKPLNIECNQKIALKQVSTVINVRVGIMELVESLYNKRSSPDTGPEVSQIITFKKDGLCDVQKSMYSSMQGASPCLNVELKSISTNKSLSHLNIPRTDVSVSLGELQTELDLTLIDRVNTIITPEMVIQSNPLAGASMYHTVGAPFYSMMDEGSNSIDEKYVISVSCPNATVNLRFPIPDLRQEPHVDKSWYHRNLRDDVLTLDLHDVRFQTTYLTNQPLEQIHLMCSDIHGFYKPTIDSEGEHFAHIAGEGGEEGFNTPSLTVRFCNTSTSLLDEDMYTDDTTPKDSLNGACQFARSEPSPFSSKRFMHDSDVGDEKTEQMVLPADREELNDFMQKSVSNTKMMVDIVLPKVCGFFPNKNLFEILYNRFNNDLLLWEPSAPAPVTNAYEKYSMPQQQWDLNVYNQFIHNTEHFEMAKSGLQLDTDSDSDSENVNHYSIHDSRNPRRKRQPRQLQSKMCVTLSIGKGRLTAFTEAKDPTGCVLTSHHGEILLQLSDLLLFTVSAHNGDPSLQFINVLANRIDLYHEAGVENSPETPVVNCSELSKHVPSHLQSKHLIYRSEKGVLVTTQDKIGQGGDSLDMLCVAIKIKLSTMASKTDLTVDEKVKEFLVSVGIRGATLRHMVLPPYQNVFVQLMNFLDLKDYPILGYVDPTVLTELHVHLWTCAIDYRPKNLALTSVLTAESFSISSNIVTESAISLLRFVLDDGALYLSKRKKEQKTDLSKYFVCVADIGRLEITLRSNDGKDPRFPKTDLRVSTNRLNIRTCADSCIALIDLIQYLAADGDLLNGEPDESDTNTETEANISINTDDGEMDDQLESLGLAPLSASKIDHVHNLLSDAMMQSSDSEESEEDVVDLQDVSRRPKKQTEVFFVPELGPDSGLGAGSQRAPIVITQNVDSVTSSTISGMAGSFHDSPEQDEDDFCFIDDAAWGKSHKDGEPTIRVFAQTTVEIKDNYFAKPIGRTDLLKAPDTFPLAEYRYTLKDLTVVWHIYGGKDFSDGPSFVPSSEERVNTEMNRDSLTVSYHSGTNRWSGHAAGREAPLVQRESLQTKGGPHRDTSKCMEFQLTKVRFQQEEYPLTTEQASRQVLLISDMEIRDKLKQSKINKFLYQFSSEDMPKQTYANMVHLKAIHRRPNPPVPEEECSIKLSIQPIRLNIDQDTLFFLKSFIMELSGSDETCLSEPAPSDKSPSHGAGSKPPPPVLTVNKPDNSETAGGPQELLMQFDEFTQDLQASLGGSLVSSTKSEKSGSNSEMPATSVDGESDTSVVTPRSSQPVFIKSFVFSPDVPIKLDYHGKFDREHGAMATLGGLVSLHSAEIKLKRLQYKQGLLGTDKLVSFCLNEWLTDIKVNQLPNILGGFGPMHSFVQLGQGIRDLFWLPVEQYRKDGRIVRGIQRGAASFTMSTAMSMLELTNRVVQGVQWCAELTFDMVSSGPRRRGYYPRQPADLREGVSNAYLVIREGFSETASNIVDIASKEHESKGMMGAVGGVLRQIPPTFVQPLIILPEATSNLLGGLRSQLKPDVKKEDEEKWKEEIID